VFSYLIVAPRDCDVVSFPNGSRTVTARGAGAQAAADPAAAPSAPTDDERTTRLQAAHREWAERLDRALDASTSISHARMIREAFVAENPEPQLDGAAEEGPSIEEARWWCATCEGADVEAWLAEADAEYPLRAVARVLSELERDGWELRHVAEDKRVVHDESASRAELTGARFLLRHARQN
jgi:hypothetical protein